ncbi:MAG: PEP-CTERM sorting domain-containing protein [Terriglobales bacterium]
MKRHCFPPLPKTLGLAIVLCCAVALASAPAWAGPVNNPAQVTFSQNNNFGMGNFNGSGGGLYQPGESFGQDNVVFTDGVDSPLGTPVSTPEPASWLLLGAGLLTLGAAGPRRRRLGAR